MGDKDEKKKKKKSKKKEEEAPPPEPEPEPAPAPAPEEEEWPPKFNEEAGDASAQNGEPPAEAPAEGEAPPDGEAPPPAEGEEGLPEGEDEPMPIEKRKSPYPVFWNRPKAKMYRMNFDYGENYYRSMVNYLDHKSSGGFRGIEAPRAESWAERAHKSASMRYPKQDVDISELLHTVRSNIRGYDMHHKQYTSKVQSVYGPKAF